jgi:hypothetical protein
MEHVEHAEEKTEHIGPTDDPDAGFRPVQVSQGFIKRCTCGIPVARPAIRGMRRNVGDTPGQDQPLTQRRSSKALLRVPPMHHDIIRVETLLK